MAQAYAKLCQRCSQLVVQIPGKPTEYATTHHNSIQECEEGSRDGCEFCKYILDTSFGKVLADGAGNSKLDMISPYGTRMELNVYGDPPLLDIKISPFVIAKNLRVYTFPDDQLASVLGGRPFTDGAASLEAYNMVNNWICQCISQHEHCSYNKDAELPTRVLDVSHDQSQDVRLFVPGQHDLRVGRYTALSYCWGMTSCVKTTSLNFSDHLKNISFRSLPGTIQDAICITRALNIRFLWVDALCIIQGRDEVARKDWGAESSKMRTVYGNAFVTLSAAGAPNCQAGMFFPRSPRSPVSLRFLAFNYNDMVDGYVYVDIPFRRFSLSDDEPIDKRAWTLQERLLSPRLVKYGTYAISWECRSASLSEFDAAVKTDSLKFYRLPRLLTTDQWMRVIEDYSSRNITFIEDRIPAISGIVQQFQKCLKMRYVAGLWDSKSDHTILLRLLIWNVVFDTEQQWNNMARLPGPTWSWLSVNTPVSWRYPPADPGDGTSLRLDTRRDFVRWHAEIIDCQVRQDESSPLYPIRDCCITIRGILKQIKALTVGELRDQLYILDPPEDIGARRGVAKFDLVHDSPFQYIGGKTRPSCILHGENGIALPSCLYLADVKVKAVYDTTPCGILVAADHGSPQQWRKVGVFSLLDYEIYSVIESGWLGEGVLTEIELV